jgi:hypothetical protein
MGDNRYSRDDQGRRDTYEQQDQSRWDRDDAYSSGGMGRDDGRYYRSGEYGNQRYGQREQMNRGIDYGRSSNVGDRDYYGGNRSKGQGGSNWSQDRNDDRGYGHNPFGQGSAAGRSGYDRDDYGSNSYGQNRFGANHEGYGDRHPNDRGFSQQRSYGASASSNRGYVADGSTNNRDYGARPKGYNYEDRGFFDRAGDEVRSWFGDEEAERRRDQDARLDERYQSDRDSDYGSWRRGQIDKLDRDYHEYRQENRTKFENEFSSWRSTRQTQRDSLDQVKEHMEVVGSDGSHVGTVDKVRGDRIILTKNDKDAGGHHHSLPSSWLTKVDDKVTLSKTADEAKKAWRDEENRSLIGDQGGSSNGWLSGSSNGWSSGSPTGASGSSSTAMAGTGTPGSTVSATGEISKNGLNKSTSGSY